MINLDTQYSIIKDVVKKEFNWRVSLKDPSQQGVDWDIQWSDVAPSIDKYSKLKPYQKINHFPGMFQIARKNYLARNLKKMQKQFPNDYKFFPKTWLLPYEFNELKNQMLESQKKNIKSTYIVKPECLSQGKGIYITNKIDQIEQTEHLVVQKYLRQPYLIDEYKFDLRIYVLVTNVQPLRIFMHHEGLTRFASEKYKLKAFNNPFIHLTNYAINKDNENFQADQTGETGHKRSLESIFKKLAEEGVNVIKLKEKIKDLIIKTLISIQPDLIHNYRTSQPGDIFNNMFFEILGFDVIIDKNEKPYLLEVNHAPSFNGDTQLDKQVKRNLLNDTFKLLNISLQEKQKILDILKQISESRISGSQKGNKQLQSIQRQDLYIEKLKERDIYENQNLGGFEKLYPPCQQDMSCDYEKLKYYLQFQEHAKKYMMDFKVVQEESKSNKKQQSVNRSKTENRITSNINKQSLTAKEYKQQSKQIDKSHEQQHQTNQFQIKNQITGNIQQNDQFRQEHQEQISASSSSNENINVQNQDNPQSCMFEQTNNSFEQQDLQQSRNNKSSKDLYTSVERISNISQSPSFLNNRQIFYKNAINDQMRQLEESSQKQTNIALNLINANMKNKSTIQYLNRYQKQQSDCLDSKRHQEYKSYLELQCGNQKQNQLKNLHQNHSSSASLLPSLSKTQISCSIQDLPATYNKMSQQTHQTQQQFKYQHIQRSISPSKQKHSQLICYQFPLASSQIHNENQIKSKNAYESNFVPKNFKYHSPQKRPPIESELNQKTQLNKLSSKYKYSNAINQDKTGIQFCQISFSPPTFPSRQKVQSPLKYTKVDSQIKKNSTNLTIKYTKNTSLKRSTNLGQQLIELNKARRDSSFDLQKMNKDEILNNNLSNNSQCGLNSVIENLDRRNANLINRLLPQLNKYLTDKDKIYLGHSQLQQNNLNGKKFMNLNSINK